MTTLVLYAIGIIFVLALIKGAYWLAVTYLLSEEPWADEVHTIATPDRWQIKLFRFNGGGEPVLLCHGLMANHFNFAYPRGRALVDALKARGYDCWAIELRGTRRSRAPMGHSRYEAELDDYLLKDLPTAVEFILKNTGFQQLHWVGHSLGGMLLYAYELIHGNDRIACAVTLGSPTNFDGAMVRRHHRLIRFLKAAPSVFDAYVRGLAPLVPLVRPKTGMIPVNWDNVDPEIDTGTFYNLVDMAPPNVIETLSHWAWSNDWRVNRGQTNILPGFSNIRTPMFLIYGARDPLAPPSNGRAFYETIASTEKDMLVLGEQQGHSADYSHIDLAFARNGLDEIAAPIASWLDAHPLARGSLPELLETRADGAQAEVAAVGGDTSWGRALKTAADVLKGLDDSPKGTTKAKTRNKRAAAKQARKRGATRKTKKSASKAAKASKSKTKKRAARKSPTKAKLKRAAAKKSRKSKTTHAKTTAKKARSKVKTSRSKPKAKPKRKPKAKTRRAGARKKR